MLRYEQSSTGFCSEGFDVANVYHANFRCTDPRPGRKSKSFTFGAADDGAAAAVVAELGNWTTGQCTSLTKNVASSWATPYPTGTRITANWVVSDSLGNVWRGSVRNFNFAITGNPYNALSAVLLGTGYVDPAYTITALGAPPLLPNSGNPVAVVNDISFVTKSG